MGIDNVKFKLMLLLINDYNFILKRTRKIFCFKTFISRNLIPKKNNLFLMSSQMNLIFKYLLPGIPISYYKWPSLQNFSCTGKNIEKYIYRNYNLLNTSSDRNGLNNVETKHVE